MTVTEEQIEAAARWFISTPKAERPRPLNIEMRERFGFAPLDVIAAIKKADDLRGYAHHG